MNEPDEGRYSVIASEMIETSNWLVPQLWYVPHLDKPPLTYWAVAASMKLFGRNEWAVRLTELEVATRAANALSARTEESIPTITGQTSRAFLGSARRGGLPP